MIRHNFTLAKGHDRALIIYRIGPGGAGLKLALFTRLAGLTSVPVRVRP